MEIPASVQAMIADLCVGNCGHFHETQLISTQMLNYEQFFKQFVKYTVYLDRNY